MTKLGYQEKKGGGSRRKFVHVKTKAMTSLHEPHPKQEMKSYALDIVIEHLKEEGLI